MSSGIKEKKPNMKRKQMEREYGCVKGNKESQLSRISGLLKYFLNHLQCLVSLPRLMHYRPGLPLLPFGQLKLFLSFNTL